MRLKNIYKAGAFTCLFLFFTIQHVSANSSLERWHRNLFQSAVHPETLKFAYLQSDLSASEYAYLSSINQFLFIVFNKGNDQLLDQYKHHIDSIQNTFDPNENSFNAFVSNDLLLQKTLVYYLSGEYFQAALSFLKCKKRSKELIKQYPFYLPAKRTSAIIEVLLGYIPDSYSWAKSIFGLQGNMAEGIKALGDCALGPEFTTRESLIFLMAFNAFLREDNNEAAANYELMMLHYNPTNLEKYIRQQCMRKAHQSLDALEILSPDSVSVLFGSYTEMAYQSGSLMMENGQFSEAVPWFEKFLENRQSERFVPASMVKLAACYKITGNKTLEEKWMAKVKSFKDGQTGADRNALEMAVIGKLPPASLLKARYLIDGGMYAEAKKILAGIYIENYADQITKTEISYRKGRLAHLLNDFTTAIENYEQTISLQEDEEWYFAQAAQFYLGNVYEQLQQNSKALEHYQKVTDYKGSAYSESFRYKSGLRVEALIKN